MKSPAGFWIRLGAALLDGLIIGIPLAFLSYLVTGDLNSSNPGDTWWVNGLSLLYAVLLPVRWHGYVVGKKLAGIRIVKADGSAVNVGTMLLRVLVGGLVYGITFGAALIASAIMVAARADKRSLHDLIAGTYVTSLPPAANEELNH
ncbi:RDD family protein [Fictibacillus iocasae]|uniref:RDD family protein n=1 Tax=Fictibacillus iocasae TaxID=2715437 RepID=A0ABW2NQC9_9BACL